MTAMISWSTSEVENSIVDKSAKSPGSLSWQWLNPNPNLLAGFSTNFFGLVGATLTTQLACEKCQNLAVCLMQKDTKNSPHCRGKSFGVPSGKLT